MHGAGGCGFFGNSRKALKSAGVRFAIEQFIIVSPRCTWSWKESPQDWIDDLVRTLKAADYVDENRIYLAGCSMGGMGVWEVGARMSDTFAAIAPVAGHHKEAKVPAMVESLRDTPIFVCHSTCDTTCPLKKELPLWRELRSVNQRMQINLSTSVDHCNMMTRNFCDDTYLYEWLLMHKQDAAVQN
jgi:predicted peptidase